LSAEDANDPAKKADRQHFEDAITLLRGKGATLVPVGQLGEGVPYETHEQYNDALLSDVKHQLEAYLAGRAGLPVKSLAELIEFNERNSGPGVPDQQMLTMINGMDISDEARNELWAAIGPIFKSTIDKPLAEHKLDAIVSNFHSYSYYYSAVAGYPGISIPSGMDDEGMPTAVHFYGKNLSEATLLSVAYGYEQASQAIRKPAFKPGLR
ncbi:MAG: amidase family protein, partial [Pseudomonas sp.]